MKVGLSDYLLMLNSSSQAPNNFETEKLGARHTCESSGSCLGSPDGVVVQRINARVVCAPSFVGSAAWSRFGAGGRFPLLAQERDHTVRRRLSDRCTKHQGHTL